MGKLCKRLSVFVFIAILSACFAAAALRDFNPKLYGKVWKGQWVDGGAFEGYQVLHFRRTFDLKEVPKQFKINVSADNRYRLFVNGKSVSAGPARGDLQHWFFDTVDIAPFLKEGKNAIAAVVWDMGNDAPNAQFSHRAGFILDGATEAEEFVATPKNWKVKRSRAYSTPKSGGFRGAFDGYSFTGGTDMVDGEKFDWGWNLADYDDSDWGNPRVIASGKSSSGQWGEIDWVLTPREIPMLEEKPQRLKSVRKFSGVENVPEFFKGKADFIVPPNSTCRILLDNGVLTNAYPRMILDGGKGAEIKITYGEALFDSKGAKANRNEVEGRDFDKRAVFDVFKPDGGKGREFSTLWFRTYRYVGLDIRTADEPLVVKDFYGIFTGYPFAENGSFDSSDKSIKDIWDVGWRTARLCAVETYFDCPYYEQLQYVGDTRIQSLISLYVSGDDRLMRQAISAFDSSRESNGLTKSRYPSRTPQYIPPFSLYWVSMVNDYAMHRSDDEFVRSMLGGVRTVLAWYLNQIDPEKGVLRARVPYWNFVDWSKGWWSGYAPEGENDSPTVNSLHLAYTLRQASELMNHYGYAAEAEAYRAEYDKLVKAVKKVAWDENRKMFADYAGAKTFSQHPNIMAILSDAIPASEQKRLFEKIISDKSLTQCTFYYRFYLTEAMLKVGLADMYVSELKPWRDMLGIGLSTFAENPEPTRSDCHAWSSSPNYHLLSLVCGVRPGSYGFKSARIEPHLCGLNYIKGVIPHPLGNISVDLKRAGENSVEGTVELPKGLDGEFVWNGKSLKLSAGKNAVNPM